jgi:hypothetical protein
VVCLRILHYKIYNLFGEIRTSTIKITFLSDESLGIYGSSLPQIIFLAKYINLFSLGKQIKKIYVFPLNQVKTSFLATCLPPLLYTSKVTLSDIANPFVPALYCTLEHSS